MKTYITHTLADAARTKTTAPALQHVLACLLLPIALVLAPRAAQAEQPVTLRFDETFVEPWLSEALGFTMQLHVELHQIRRTDPSGATWSEFQRITFTNLENLKSAVAILPSHVVITETIGDDGLVTSYAYGSGPYVLKAARGGVEWMAAGRSGSKMVWDPETSEVISYEVIFAAGKVPDTDELEALYTLLSD